VLVATLPIGPTKPPPEYTRLAILAPPSTLNTPVSPLLLVASVVPVISTVEFAVSVVNAPVLAVELPIGVLLLLVYQL
jgi:hypothetical protein